MYTFTLPSLPYTYDALRQWVDAKTMEIHYTKHHQAYVDKLNQALGEEGMEAYPQDLADFCRQVDKATSMGIRNNLGGHYNHTLFWKSLSPKVGLQPSHALAQSIDTTFGNMEGFQKAFTKAALARFGAGWAWLVVHAERGLCVTSTPNQDNPLMDVVPRSEQGVPVLGLDVWEHAYYLRYQHRRADYVAGFWQAIDWETASSRYAKATGR